MKKLAGLLLAACLLLPFQARAVDTTGIYVAPKLMIASTSYKTDLHQANITWGLGSFSKSKFGAGIAAGYDFYPMLGMPIRAELEYAAYSKFNGGRYVDGANYHMDVQAQTLFLNGYVDWHNASQFTPYAGAGLGFGFLSGQMSISDRQGTDWLVKQSKKALAWNVGLGCAFRLTDNVALDFGYRYASLGKAKSGSTWDLNANTNRVGIHNLVLGARVTF